MRFAIQTPPEHTDFASLRDVWQAADELGIHAAFTFDHLLPLNGDTRRGSQFEGWTILASLAAHTRRLQVGTLVSGVTYRHPVVLAKMAVTLDQATDGRAILGIGAAWHETEHLMYGIPFPPVGERMGRLQETLEMFRLVCTQRVTDFEGRYYRLAGAVFEPKPVRPGGIPVLVGGSGRRLREIAVRYADIFNSFYPPWEWESVNADLDDKLVAAGRRTSDLTRSAFVFSELSGRRDREEELIAHFERTRGGSEQDIRRRVLAGDAEGMISVVKTYAEAGVSLITINMRPPFGTEGLERLARDVLPAFAKA